jgi:hypothetical protein
MAVVKNNGDRTLTSFKEAPPKHTAEYGICIQLPFIKMWERITWRPRETGMYKTDSVLYMDAQNLYGDMSQKNLLY